MILGLLKRVGISREDKIIIAVDARNSWRKAFYRPYKAQRKKLREDAKLIDWQYHYDKIDKMNQKLNESTNWHFIKLSKIFTYRQLCDTKYGKEFKIFNQEHSLDEEYGIEADDIQACACTFFKDKEVVLITNDKDLEQLDYFDNTKIFSMNVKYKNGVGCYKIIDNPKKILADKIRLGDISDNIITSENDTENDVNIRKFIINLLKMPEFLTDIINKEFSYLKEKQINYNNLPYPNSFGKTFDSVYGTKNIITYEDSLKKHNKDIKKKKEKAKQQREKKKLNFR